MTSNTIPIYRNGRKFYVSTEEYERIRAEERLQRHSASQKSQFVRQSKSPQPFTRIPSTPSYTPIQRTQSNPYDYKYGILRTPYVPANSLINSLYRREPNRLSRSILRTPSNYDDLLTLTSAVSKKQTPPTTTTRAHSSDKSIDNQQTLSSSSNNDNETKRSSSADTNQLLSSAQQQQQHKSKQSIQSSLRRPGSSIVHNYGISPLTAFSMTPKDQSHTHTHSSKLTNYLVRMKPSSLNSASKASRSTANSIFESTIQGSDNIYTVLGTSNPSNDNNKNEDSPTNQLVDDNSTSLLSLILRRNTDINRSRRSDYVNETDDESNPQRDLWTRSTIRSQSSDGLTEKKRVRFADTEGQTLEQISDQTKLKAAINNRLLLRRQHAAVSNESRPQPFYNALYQATATKIGESKLATDV